VENVKAA